MVKRHFKGLILASSLALLAACESAEERAETHFQTAIELIESGDFARATIEFRNVFKLNGNHHEARLTFARMQREQGKLSQAYGQYLRLVEQNPAHFEGQVSLAEMALQLGNWDDVKRHGQAAIDLDPEALEPRAVMTALSYRDAVLAKDTETRDAAVRTAEELAKERPGSFALQQVIIDKMIREEDWTGARRVLDEAIKGTPDLFGLYALRLSVMSELGDTQAVESGFKEMIALFPENEETRGNLLQWYLSQNNIDGAEGFLREQIDPAETDSENRIALISFLAQVRGPEVAREELARIIAETGDEAVVFRTLRAALAFDMGETEAARQELEDILSADPEPTSDINDAKVTLAQMDLNAGNAVGARARVEEVLAADSTHVAAMKLKANWLIEDDETGDAIVLLREALGNAPRDPELMTLLAKAHERNGSRDLMAEMLSLAVEASGNAPAESLRYATLLSKDDKALPAEDILQDALRAQPNNQDLLGALGLLYLQLQDWGRLDGVITRLGQLGRDNATNVANELNARKLAAQGQEDELVSFLEQLTEQDGGNRMGLIRAHISRNNVEAALREIDLARAETPDDLSLRFIQAAVLAGGARYDEAEAMFRALTEDVPQSNQAWIALYRLQLARGKTESASAVLQEALAVLPASLQLLWAQAGEMEARDDIDGAISIYEDLYAENSDNLIIANNLASLLSTRREDAESLQRAWQVGRRLQGSDVPAFQDTYGWIAYRRGDMDAALRHLEPAAEALADDPRVQYHLAATYAARGETDAALEQFRKVAALPGNDNLIDTVTAEIERLTAPATQN